MIKIDFDEWYPIVLKLNFLKESLLLFQDQQPDERRILVPKESKNLFRVSCLYIFYHLRYTIVCFEKNVDLLSAIFTF